MEIEIISKGDLYDDNPSLKMIVHSPDMLNAITLARQEIRCRLKYNEDLSLDEINFLEKIQGNLYIEGIE